MSLSVKHLLGIKELLPQDIELIFQTADTFKDLLQRQVKKVPALRDTTIANIFFENSTRTRISFELAEKRLGADTINFSASGSSVSKGETLIDTNHIDASIINAGDGTNEHPTQALLDAFSIREKLGNIKGKRVAILGDIMHSRVALSNIYCLSKLGAEVMVAGPPTLIPKHIAELGVKVEYNVKKALEWCEVANVLRIQLERQHKPLFSTLREYSLYYGVNRQMLDSLQKEILIMHPGPINRGVEINSDVADSKQSIILDQVENGVAIRMAVMYLLSGRGEIVE